MRIRKIVWLALCLIWAVPTTASGPARAAMVAADAPSFGLFRLSREGTGIMSGKAAPGARVQILNWGQPMAELPADPHGAWVYVNSQPLRPGVYLLGLADGADQVALFVPRRGLAGFFEAAEDAVMAVSLPVGDDAASHVLQKPGNLDAPLGGRGLGFETVDAAPGGVILSGRSGPQAEVRIYLDNQLVCRPTADGEGVWRCALPATEAARLAAGRQHILRADQMTAGGGVFSRVEQAFSIQALPARAFVNGRVAVKPGKVVWQISRRLSGDAAATTLVFLAAKNQVKDPDISYPGQVMDKGR